MRSKLSLLTVIVLLLINASVAFGLEKVSLQLRWLHQYQFAGYYAAVEKGFYRDAGFDVTIVEGGLGIDTVDQVINGNSQYGVTNSELLLHRLKGKPVVVLAAIFQHSPHVFLTRNATGIKHPQDFIGKVVKMSRADRDAELHAMLRNEGVQLNQLDITDKQATPQDYLDPEIDVVASYITNQSYYLDKEHIEYTIIAPITYGVDFYGDSLFTTQQQIDQNPQGVKKFTEASLRGWKYAMDHPEEITNVIINKYGSVKTKDHLLSEAAEMQKYILPKLIEIGHMNPGRWQHIGDVFVQNGTIPDDFSLEGFIYDPLKPIETRFHRMSQWMLIVLLGACAITIFLLWFNKRLRKEIIEHEKTTIALKISQEKISFNIKQTEQFSLSAASILCIKDEKLLFASISQAIVMYSDFNRVLISLFQDEPPYRELIGFAGVDDQIVEKVRNTELSKNWYTAVFEKGYRVGQFSYYIPHTMKHILNQDATIYGEGEFSDKAGTWHPEDNLFVRMNDEKGEFCGVISVDSSKSGLQPTDEIVRPLEIYASLISQIIILRRSEQNQNQLEAKLRQAQKMEAIGNLAGGIAHDFNNILSVIIGNVDLALCIKPEQEKYVRHLSDIKSASHRAKDIVQHLLAFSRRKELEFQTVNIQKTLEDPIRFLRSTLPATISIKVNIQLNDVCVNADPTQIYQILLNICTNAAHAMEGTDGILEIEGVVENVLSFEKMASNTIAPGEYIKLTIRDNGKGISREHIHQIYDPYFTTKEVGKGTGMGLAIVHGIVESHNGTIKVESEPGCTAFEVYFPVSHTDISVESVLQVDAPISTGGGKIMLVDDTPELLDVTSKQLEDLGYSVYAFSNSEEAYDEFSQNPDKYDLIITDMTMPQLTGGELASKVLAKRPDVSIFLYTGFSEKIDENQAKAIGIKEYFEKPVSINMLAAAIEKELKSRHRLQH